MAHLPYAPLVRCCAPVASLGGRQVGLELEGLPSVAVEMVQGILRHQQVPHRHLDGRPVPRAVHVS